MGMHDYSIRLIPSSARPTRAVAIADTLQRLDFQRLGPSNIVQGARLSEPPEDEIRFIWESPLQIIEALVRTADHETLRYLSLQFAVCQPLSTVDEFLRLATSVAEKHDLTIRAGNRDYLPDGGRLSGNDDLAAAVLHDVERKRDHLHKLFGDAAADVKATSGDGWAHLLRRSPQLVG